MNQHIKFCIDCPLLVSRPHRFEFIRYCAKFDCMMEQIDIPCYWILQDATQADIALILQHEKEKYPPQTQHITKDQVTRNS